MNEDTVVKTLSLPHGRLWEWYPDANVIALSPCLDEAGREAAISEIQEQWRRQWIRIVPPALMAVAGSVAAAVELVPLALPVVLL